MSDTQDTQTDLVKRRALERSDQLADLFVLDDDVNGNLAYSPTLPARKSIKSRSKSKHTIIPYVPKPIGKTLPTPYPEYVPGGASPSQSIEEDNQLDNFILDDDDIFMPPKELEEIPVTSENEIKSTTTKVTEPKAAPLPLKPKVAKTVPKVTKSIPTAISSSSSTLPSAMADASSSANYDFSHTKMRIAHTPSYDVTQARQSSKHKHFNNQQKLWKHLMDRYNSVGPSASSTPPKGRPSTPFLSSELEVWNNSPGTPSPPAAISSSRKTVPPPGATVPNIQTLSPPPDRMLIPIFEIHTKIPFKFRSDFLARLYSELTAKEKPNGFIEMEKVVSQAKAIEHELSMRSKSKTIYKSLGVGKIQAIRNENKASKNDSINSGIPRTTVNVVATNCSIVKRERVSYQSLSTERLSEMLDKLTIPKDMLEQYGFSRPHPTDHTMAIFPSKAITSTAEYKAGIRMTCGRCHHEYSNPQVKDSDTSPCVYHGGRLIKTRDKEGWSGTYRCCKGDAETGGCLTAPFHVTDGYEFTQTRQGFQSTTASQLSPETVSIFALDCEMCYTEMALELTRVTLIDFEGKMVYDTLVKPSTSILDHNTAFSGIEEGKLDQVTTTLENVQEALLEHINGNSFLIGHGLDSDLRVLKLFHERIIDTTHLFPHRKGLPYKPALARLTSDHLSKIIQNSVEGGHDSNEDAKAALDLVKLKLQDELNKEQQPGLVAKKAKTCK